MSQLSRKYVFQNGKKANANEVNAEIDQIHALLNGNIEGDNIKNNTITKDKIGFIMASEKFRGSVPTYNELATMIQNPLHGDIAIAEGPSLEIYGYDEPTMDWKKLGGAVSTPSHNMLSGLALPDAHPMSSITGLDTKIQTIETDITNIKSTNTSQSTAIAQNTGDIQSLQTDNTTLKSGLADTYTKTQVDTKLGEKAYTTQVFPKTGGDLEGNINMVGQTMYDIMATPTAGEQAGIFIGASSFEIWRGDQWINITDTGIQIKKGNTRLIVEDNDVLIDGPTGLTSVATIDNLANKADKSVVDMFQAGSISVIPVANTPTSARVTFAKPYAAVPSITVSANTGVPGSKVIEVSFANPSTTGFDVVVYRNDTVGTAVYWQATPMTQ